jgi:hypothetical protein
VSPGTFLPDWCTYSGAPRSELHCWEMSHCSCADFSFRDHQPAWSPFCVVFEKGLASGTGSAMPSLQPSTSVCHDMVAGPASCGLLLFHQTGLALAPSFPPPIQRDFSIKSRPRASSVFSQNYF